MIIEWPLNGQFNDAVTNVLTSQTDVREVVDHDNHYELLTFFSILPLFMTQKVRMFSDVLTHKKC